MMTNNREIFLLYNKDSSLSKQTLAYAHSVSRHIKAFTFQDFAKNNTSWCRILKALDVRPKDLLDKSNPYYQEHIRGRDFDEEGWLNVLCRNPQLIKAPIAIRGGKAVLCLNPKDIYRLTEEPLSVPV